MQNSNHNRLMAVILALLILSLGSQMSCTPKAQDAGADLSSAAELADQDAGAEEEVEQPVLTEEDISNFSSMSPAEKKEWFDSQSPESQAELVEWAGGGDTLNILMTTPEDGQQRAADSIDSSDIAESAEDQRMAATGASDAGIDAADRTEKQSLDGSRDILRAKVKETNEALSALLSDSDEMRAEAEAKIEEMDEVPVESQQAAEEMQRVGVDEQQTADEMQQARIEDGAGAEAQALQQFDAKEVLDLSTFDAKDIAALNEALKDEGFKAAIVEQRDVLGDKLKTNGAIASEDIMMSIGGAGVGPGSVYNEVVAKFGDKPIEDGAYLSTKVNQAVSGLEKDMLDVPVRTVFDVNTPVPDPSDQAIEPIAIISQIAGDKARMPSISTDGKKVVYGTYDSNHNNLAGERIKIYDVQSGNSYEILDPDGGFLVFWPGSDLSIGGQVQGKYCLAYERHAIYFVELDPATNATQHIIDVGAWPGEDQKPDLNVRADCMGFEFTGIVGSEEKPPVSLHKRVSPYFYDRAKNTISNVMVTSDGQKYKAASLLKDVDGRPDTSMSTSGKTRVTFSVERYEDMSSTPIYGTYWFEFGEGVNAEGWFPYAGMKVTPDNRAFVFKHDKKIYITDHAHEWTSFVYDGSAYDSMGGIKATRFDDKDVVRISFIANSQKIVVIDFKSSANEVALLKTREFECGGTCSTEYAIGQYRENIEGIDRDVFKIAYVKWDDAVTTSILVLETISTDIE